MTAFESQEDSLLMALNEEDRARSNGCRWCLDVSGDKGEHSPLGSPEGTQSC